MAPSVSYLIQLRDRFSRTQRKLISGFDRIGVKVSSLNSKLGKMSIKLGDLGRKGFSRITLPLVAFGAASTLAFSKMEDGLANVFTLLNKGQIAKFGDQLKEAQKNALKMGFSLSDTNKALFDTISSLGISKNSLNAFNASMRLSIGGAARISSSVLGLAKVMNVYGREQTDVNRVVNAFFTAQKVGTTTVNDLALNIGTVSGAAKTLGLSFEQSLVSLSVLTNTLRNTEEASTALSSILTVLGNPAEKSKQIFDALGIEYGITAVRAAGFSKVLGKVVTALRKHPDAIAAAIPNIRAFRGLSTLTEESLSLMDTTLLQINKDIKDGTGLTEAYNRKMATMSQKLKQARGDMTLLSSEIGLNLSPLVFKLLSKVRDLSKGFSSLSPESQKNIVIFGVMAASIPPLLIGLAALLKSLKVLQLFVIKNPLVFAAVVGASFGMVAAEKLTGVKFSDVISGKATRKDGSDIAPPKFALRNNEQTVRFDGNLKIEVPPNVIIKSLSSSNPDMGLNASFAY